jgi:hypothetical protein
MSGPFGERAVFPDYAETALKEQFFGKPQLVREDLALVLP